MQTILKSLGLDNKSIDPLSYVWIHTAITPTSAGHSRRTFCSTVPADRAMYVDVLFTSVRASGLAGHQSLRPK
jgi:hypothetical protein